MRAQRTARKPAAPANRKGVRDRALAAAHELFTAQGYHATTTKEICAKAGISEPSLFRHFGSKAELFEATVLEPFTAFITSWTDSWDQLPAADPVPDLAESLLGGGISILASTAAIGAAAGAASGPACGANR